MEELAEYAQDEARMKFYEEISHAAINHFASSRLQAFYLAHPTVIQAPLDALNEARTLALNHPSAALVFAVAAAEVCFKTALLKPIFYGLVHADSSAELLMELAIAPRDKELVKTMHQILTQHGGVNLHTFKRPGSAQTLWEEMQTTAKWRNAVVHRCAGATPEEAAQAIGVAEAMIEEIFPTVLAKLGLHHHQGFHVCVDPGYENRP
jgi:hypothetical protein